MPKIDLLKSKMLRSMTPVEDYLEEYGLLVKREDLSCLPPGPQFSKTRGVYEHVKSRPEKTIGVLDTYHSQAGHAVARACQLMGKKCVNFFPVYKADTGLREPQKRSQMLGAELVGLPAGRSCILYHAAKKQTELLGGYMMPNALKLRETIVETADETANVYAESIDQVLIPASSGTIAAGVILGLGSSVKYIVHLGYSRSHSTVMKYLAENSGVPEHRLKVTLVDEGYGYKDKAKAGLTPPWPCNSYYDLKAFRWFLRHRDELGRSGLRTLLWNIG